MSEHKFNIAQFKQAFSAMVAKTERSWDSYFTNRSTRIKTYSKEEAQQIIESGDITQQQALSRVYFNRDGFYKRIILNYATLLKYVGLLIPNPNFGQKLSTTQNEKRIWQAQTFIEKLEIPSLLTRLTIKALVDGSYYGIILNLDKNGIVLMDLPSGYCRSRFRDTAGNDIIEFDIRYFDTITDEDSRQQALKAYPKLIRTAYSKYRKGRTTNRWIVLPSTMGLCIPLSDDATPLFLNIIPAIMDYDDAVDTEQKRDKDEIRKILIQKIPHLSDGSLLFEPDEAVEMHTGAVGMLQDNDLLSILTTYADVDVVSSKTAADNVSNSLNNMKQNIYSEAGVSAEIFASTGSQALNTSLTNDVALMMVIAQKYSRLITHIVNTLFANSNISFKYEILPVTYYNQSDYITDALKLAQSGYSFLLPSVALGLSQQSLMNIKELENDVLGLRDVLVPLSTSYTQSSNSNSNSAETKSESNGEVGAPEKDIEDKAEKTIQNEQSIDNQGGS